MKRKKKHAPLQGLVRGYIREISVAMFLQIQTDIYLAELMKTAPGASSRPHLT